MVLDAREGGMSVDAVHPALTTRAIGARWSPGYRARPSRPILYTFSSASLPSSCIAARVRAGAEGAAANLRLVLGAGPAVITAAPRTRIACGTSKHKHSAQTAPSRLLPLAPSPPPLRSRSLASTHPLHTPPPSVRVALPPPSIAPGFREAAVVHVIPSTSASSRRSRPPRSAHPREHKYDFRPFRRQGKLDREGKEKESRRRTDTTQSRA
ncbi:hypothetical protein C8J57DRAFT_1300413 [Mycena rebaudengoi]|nr:hypothetical protein C8J57DRAFT_1300413 [Mycena rebaudengoi]